MCHHQCVPYAWVNDKNNWTGAVLWLLCQNNFYRQLLSAKFLISSYFLLIVIYRVKHKQIWYVDNTPILVIPFGRIAKISSLSFNAAARVVSVDVCDASVSMCKRMTLSFPIYPLNNAREYYQNRRM